MKKLLLLLALFPLSAFAQQINPATQINWPLVTGTAAPTASCTSTNYGQPYLDLSTFARYLCVSGGWSQISTLFQHNGTNLADQNLLNFNDTTPAAPSGTQNITYQTDAAGDLSAYVRTSSSGFTPIPSGATVVFTGDSRLVDDSGDTLGTQYTATAASCTTSGLCTISVANSFVAGQQLYFNQTFSPSCLDLNVATGGPYSYGSGNGLYTVLSTGLSSTQFEVQSNNCTTVASGTGGKFEDATHFIPTVAVSLPGFQGIGSWSLINSVDEQNSYGGVPGMVCSASKNYAQLFHALSPVVTGKPGYLIEEGGFNDLFEGLAASTIEGCFQTLFSEAHADGWKIIEISPASGSFNSGTAFQSFGLLTQWLSEQGKNSSNAGNGEYWDEFGSWAAFFGNLAQGPYNNPGDENIFGPSGANLAASIINGTVISQGSTFGMPAVTSSAVYVYNNNGINVDDPTNGGSFSINLFPFNGKDTVLETINNVSSNGGTGPILDMINAGPSGWRRDYAPGNIIGWNQFNETAGDLIGCPSTEISQASANNLAIGTSCTSGDHSGNLLLNNITNYGASLPDSSQTTVNGTTAGTAVWSQPQQGTAFKQAVLYLNGYENTTTTAQAITLPAAYATVGAVVADSGSCAGVTISGATLTLPASMVATQTGLCEVRGY